jgi:hypothetical protein
MCIEAKYSEGTFVASGDWIWGMEILWKTLIDTLHL